MSDSWAKVYEETLSTDTIISPVTAYRVWYVPLQPILQLRSYYIQTAWEPCQRLESECKNHMTCVCSGDFWLTTRREHEGPNDCTCNAGIYGWKTFDQGFEMYMDLVEGIYSTDAPEPTTNRVAFGKVYLWGKVVECEKGFRGQFAYPAGLYYTADNSPALASMYRVPLLAIKDHNRYPDEPRLCP